nr:MAG TPA: hypothetical protein [Caudoviricetes sp.]
MVSLQNTHYSVKRMKVFGKMTTFAKQLQEKVWRRMHYQ